MRSMMSGFVALPRGNVDGRAVVRVGTTLYAFMSFSNNQAAYVKSVDNGLSWSPRTFVGGIGAVGGWSIWYDKWTPGDTGTLIHIWTIDSTTDDVHYQTLDTADDSLSSVVVVHTGTTFLDGGFLSGCKAVNGYLYVAFDGNGGAETGFYRSTDAGVNWTSRDNSINEGGAGDLYQLVTAPNAADDADIQAVFWDASADALSLKEYDDSANTWAETSISGSMVEVAKATASPQFSCAIRESDGHLIVVAWNEYNTTTADLLCWDINGGASITAKTTIHTNVQFCILAHLYVDQDSDALAVTYIGSGAGTDGTTKGVYCKRSTDGGTTWGSELALTLYKEAYSFLGGRPSGSGDTHDVVFASADGAGITGIWAYADNPAPGIGRGIGRGM